MSDLFYDGNDTIYHLSTGAASFAGSMMTPYVNGVYGKAGVTAAGSTAGNGETAGTTAETSMSGSRIIQSVDDLSSEQLEAIIKYTGNDYDNINRSLRGIETLAPENHATIEAMKTALDNSALPQDMVLYRGTSTEVLGSLQNLSTDKLVGKVITERGFMSTTTNSAVAKGFSGNMQMTIQASQGVQALDVSSISQYAMESEVLFNAGQDMMITAAEVKEGVLYITVEIK